MGLEEKPRCNWHAWARMFLCMAVTRVLDAIKNEIRNATVNLYTADFSSLADVKRMAEEIIQEQKNKCFSEQCRKFL